MYTVGIIPLPNKHKPRIRVSASIEILLSNRMFGQAVRPETGRPFQNNRLILLYLWERSTLQKEAVFQVCDNRRVDKQLSPLDNIFE